MKESILLELRELAKAGILNTMQIVEDVIAGKYDETILDSANMGITGKTDLIIMLAR